MTQYYHLSSCYCLLYIICKKNNSTKLFNCVHYKSHVFKVRVDGHSQGSSICSIEVSHQIVAFNTEISLHLGSCWFNLNTKRVVGDHSLTIILKGNIYFGLHYSLYQHKSSPDSSSLALSPDSPTPAVASAVFRSIFDLSFLIISS